MRSYVIRTYGIALPLSPFQLFWKESDSRVCVCVKEGSSHG